MTLRVTWAYACDRCGALVEVSSDVQPMPLGWARVETLDMNGGMLQRRHLCEKCSPDLSMASKVDERHVVMIRLITEALMDAANTHTSTAAHRDRWLVMAQESFALIGAR